MHKNNFQFYDFFSKWHFDSNGNDIFSYRGVNFGFALRLEIWNDLTYYLRLRYCLNELLKIRFNHLVIGTEVVDVKKIIVQLGLGYVEIQHSSNKLNPFQSFYFPIHNWLDEKIRYVGFRGLKYKFRDILGYLQALIMLIFDKLFSKFKSQPLIYIQEYHPTKQIINSLVRNTKVRILLSSFSKNIGTFRYVPILQSSRKYENISQSLLEKLRKNKFEKYYIGNIDVSNDLFEIIESRISKRLPDYINNLNSIINYISKNNLKLIVLITNLGKVSTLIDCVGRHLNIPNYLIINGFMSGDFLDESKYAQNINSYSESIKQNYFKNANNVFALGDPRMDAYSMIKPKLINRVTPTITIGTSGFNTIDLNSFSAVEFDFLYQILCAIAKIQKINHTVFRIILKVRPNGYSQQYYNFISKYFLNLNIVIYDTINMKDVLLKTDLYISLHSQTLFEASCMGIPVIYHKNDSEFCHPPFDNNSELVTTNNTDELYFVLLDFLNNDEKFNKFLEKKVMEKYIGPLDGLNLERNINYIYSLINK
jgi:hypothetical protein